MVEVEHRRRSAFFFFEKPTGVEKIKLPTQATSLIDVLTTAILTSPQPSFHSHMWREPMRLVNLVLYLHRANST